MEIWIGEHWRLNLLTRFSIFFLALPSRCCRSWGFLDTSLSDPRLQTTSSRTILLTACSFVLGEFPLWFWHCSAILCSEWPFNLLDPLTFPFVRSILQRTLYSRPASTNFSFPPSFFLSPDLFFTAIRIHPCRASLDKVLSFSSSQPEEIQTQMDSESLLRDLDDDEEERLGEIGTGRVAANGERNGKANRRVQARRKREKDIDEMPLWKWWVVLTWIPRLLSCLFLRI